MIHCFYIRRRGIALALCFLLLFFIGGNFVIAADVSDSGVSIIVPTAEEANCVTAGTKTDLLEGVSIVTEGDGGTESYNVKVFSVVDSETQLPVALDDERILSAEAGHSYLIVYAAYNEAGELKATAERVVSAVTPMMLEETSGTTPLYVYDITLKDGTVIPMTRMIEYAAGTDGSDVTITIFDKDNKKLNPDENNQYEVTAGEQYNVKFLYTGDVLAKGKYYITFTADMDNFNQGEELIVTGNNGEEVRLGSWSFVKTENDTVLLVFDITEDMTNYSDITLVADVACTFSYENSDLDFDGGINITIKPGESTGSTKVNKWSKRLVRVTQQLHGDQRFTDIPIPISWTV